MPRSSRVIIIQQNRPLQRQIRAMLESHAFLKGLKLQQIKALVAISECLWVEAEEVLFGSGERSRFFYLLVSGSMSLEMQTSVYTFVIQQLERGEAFGWSALVDQPYRAFQIRAREPSLLIRIRGDHLQNTCKSDVGLGAAFHRKLAAMIAQRLRATELRLLEFCGNSAARQHG